MGDAYPSVASGRRERGLLVAPDFRACAIFCSACVYALAYDMVGSNPLSVSPKCDRSYTVDKSIFLVAFGGDVRRTEGVS